MKIVGVDNLNSEAVADVLWLGMVPDTPECREFAERVCNRLNEDLCDGQGMFYVLKPDDYRLSRGMEDLV